jgi:hypothetical protein
MMCKKCGKNPKIDKPMFDNCICCEFEIALETT